jgi:hypothetical protein
MNWRSASFLVWGVILVSFVLLELLARALRRTSTLSEVLSAIMSRTSLRVAFVLGWMWLGWHAFAR